MSVGGGLQGGYGESDTQFDKKMTHQGPGELEVRAEERAIGDLGWQQQAYQDAYRQALWGFGSGYKTDAYSKLGREAEMAALRNNTDRATGRAPILSPQEQALLDEYYGNMQRTGLADIQKFAQQNAAARGFSVSDSPIYDETGRQARELIQGLSADKAKQAFAVRDSNAAFNQGLQQFQAQLRQQAWNNRLALTNPTAAQQIAGNLYGARVGVVTGMSGSTNNQNWNVSGNVSAGYPCMIAQAIYGADGWEWLAARRYIFDLWQGRTAAIVRALYRATGPAVAWAVRHVPGVRAALKPLFDVAVERGR